MSLQDAGETLAFQLSEGGNCGVLGVLLQRPEASMAVRRPGSVVARLRTPLRGRES
jgi:hypothetical protein